MLLKKPSLAILFAMFSLFSCVDQADENLQTQNVEFSFEAISAASNGRISSENLPDSIAMVISLSNSAGADVLKFQRINLWRLNGTFVTEPLALTPGSYAVKDFLLVDGNSNILFATPLKDAPYSKLVTKALPFTFTVSANKTNAVKMEVVDASLATPEDFGYVSFNLNFTHPLKITVFRTVLGTPKMTNAKAYIYDGDILKASYSLAIQANIVPFKLDPSKIYKLVIKKDGFSNFEQTFTYNDLIASFGTKGLEVTMQSLTALRIIADKSFNLHRGQQYLFVFSAKASITVDWGHGDIQTLNYSGKPDASNNGNAMYAYRDYRPNADTVYIKGDLDLISRFEASNALTSINLGVLPYMAGLSLSDKIPTLDLSTNTRLTYLSLIGINVDTLILPATSNLRLLYLFGGDEQNEWHNNDMLNYIITNMYNNAVAKNIKRGAIQVNYSQLIIIPEEQAKLDYMKNTLGWSILTTEPEE